ncbi:hypothetical protein OS035_24535 [Rhizobium sp. 268]|uniref:hypothetical protein n=1 Tax=Rhizobium sp. 268 TaxID=2996375 RepID=UPI002F9264CB
MKTTYQIHAESVRAMRLEGLSFNQIAAQLGISKTQVRRIAARLEESAAEQYKSGIDQSEIRIATKPQKKSSKPTADDIRERVATDELTVPFSNWLGHGWVREAGDAQEVYETDEDGVQQLVGMKIDPGVLWPDDWTGPKTVDDIWISPNVPAPRRTLKQGFILSGAQNKTPAHGPLVINMHALAAARGYDYIEIGPFTYGKSLFTEKKKKDIVDVAPWSGMIADRITRSRRHLSPKVQACYEMNLRPTKSAPLNGLHEYVRGKSAVFAHPRREMLSLPRPKSAEPIYLWTTGACTVPNYVEMEAGLKALENHTIGFLIVEIDTEDRVFCRNVDADPVTGNFHDLDLYVTVGNVYTLAEAIEVSGGLVDRPFMPVGCTHRKNLHAPFARALWGIGGQPAGDVPLIDLVQACGQTINDLTDGVSINHHEDKNPIALYKRRSSQNHLLEPELKEAADFLGQISRPWCKTFVTYSNHDDFFARWLQRPSTEIAVENSKLWHKANYMLREAIDNGEKFDVYDWVLRESNPHVDFTLVDVDTPLVFYGCHYEFHGHKGTNGAKGSTTGLSRLGICITKAHSHSPAIRGRTHDLGNLIFDAPYATGPTSWGNMTGLGHSDGNRQLCTLVGDKYRA